MNQKTFEDAEEIRICQGDIDYQGIIKHINDGVVIIREEKVVFANNAFYDISQKGPEQVIGVRFLRLHIRCRLGTSDQVL